MNRQTIKDRIKFYACEELGFDDCRFTDLITGPHLDTYRQWLKDKKHGEMAYLENHLPFKEDLGKLLEGAKSAIVLIKNYKNTPEQALSGDLKISRYAVGKDYHTVIQQRLGLLAEFLQKQGPGIRCYWGTDSRPLPERTLALKAGIGFLGKNSMVIKPGLGSYFFIGTVLTTAELEPDQPIKWNCGECRLCLDACPTDALNEPYQVNATQCISYMTIEQKSQLTPEQRAKTKGWLFGCDICQEVCPYNIRAPLTTWPEFTPEEGVGLHFFQNDPETSNIPKNTPLYRSRKRVMPNWKSAVTDPK